MATFVQYPGTAPASELCLDRWKARKGARVELTVKVAPCVLRQVICAIVIHSRVRRWTRKIEKASHYFTELDAHASVEAGLSLGVCVQRAGGRRWRHYRPWSIGRVRAPLLGCGWGAARLDEAPRYPVGLQTGEALARLLLRPAELRQRGCALRGEIRYRTAVLALTANRTLSGLATLQPCR